MLCCLHRNSPTDVCLTATQTRYAPSAIIACRWGRKETDIFLETPAKVLAADRPKGACLTSGPTFVTLRPWNAFGLTLPDQTLPGPKCDFPISSV